MRLSFNCVFFNLNIWFLFDTVLMLGGVLSADFEQCLLFGASHYCYWIHHYYPASWQVTRSALHLSAFWSHATISIPSLMVDQRFSVQLNKYQVSCFSSTSKKEPPYSEKRLPPKQRKQLANISWLGWRVLLLLFNLWLKGNKSWQIPSAQWPQWQCA